MIKSKFLRDIFNVASSNVISLLASILTGLILPKLLGTTEYGYYRMFVLYMSYTAFLHFGSVDGLLLKDSGYNPKDLSIKRYRSNSIIFIIIQLLVSIILVNISFLIHNHIYSLLCLLVGIGTFLFNVSTYYQFISQILMKFKRLSICNLIQSILIICLVSLTWIISIHKSVYVNSTFYIIGTLSVYFISMIIYIFIYRDITFGNHDSLLLGLKRFVFYCKTGIYLTIAYQVSNLLLIIDNQIVSMFFKANTYGKYSFSYSITNTIVTVLSAVSTVILPHLKHDHYAHMIHIYPKLISSMMLIVYFSLISYFPLCLFIRYILPNYSQSLSYLRIFLPELGITCCVTMIIFNYYNALGKSKFYFYMSLCILLISSIIDSMMYIIIHNPWWVAFGSFISLFIWYIFSEHFLIKWCNIKWKKNFNYMIIMIVLFFISSIINNLAVGFVLYLFGYIIISVIMMKNEIINDLDTIF